MMSNRSQTSNQYHPLSHPRDLDVRRVLGNKIGSEKQPILIGLALEMAVHASALKS